MMLDHTETSCEKWIKAIDVSMETIKKLKIGKTLIFRELGVI